MPSVHLAGKVAVVTGAASGICQAIAIAFAEAGANVFLHTRRNADGLRETAERIRGMGRAVELHLADLADETALEPLVETAWKWQSGVDIWVNNAGVDVLTGSLAEASFAQKLERLWEVDVRATMLLSRMIGWRMRTRRQELVATRETAMARGTEPVILNMGWDQAEHGMSGDSGEMFAATKGAVIAFTRSLAQSLAPEVRVNCLAPGWIRTSWGHQASDYWQERAKSESLLARWGEPDDVAEAALFLASPAASFITGQTLPINGGWRRGASS